MSHSFLGLWSAGAIQPALIWNRGIPLNQCELSYSSSSVGNVLGVNLRDRFSNKRGVHASAVHTETVSEHVLRT